MCRSMDLKWNFCKMVAAYTKNQAWKSPKVTLNLVKYFDITMILQQGTLHAPPPEEVKLEDHCQHQYIHYMLSIIGVL